MGAIIKNLSKNVVTAVIFRVLLVLLLLSCVVITTTNLMEYNELQKEKEILEVKKQMYIEKNEEIGYYLNAKINLEYVKIFARNWVSAETVIIKGNE